MSKKEQFNKSSITYASFLLYPRKPPEQMHGFPKTAPYFFVPQAVYERIGHRS